MTVCTAHRLERLFRRRSDVEIVLVMLGFRARSGRFGSTVVRDGSLDQLEQTLDH